VQSEYAKRKVSYALRHRGPVGRERKDLECLPYGAKIAVYREGKGWTGPWRFVSIDGDTVVVLTGHGRKLFRSSVVKPWIATESDVNSTEADNSPTQQIMCAMFGEEGLDLVEDARTEDYRDSRGRELQGLLDTEMFAIVQRSSVPEGTRIYKTRWVDTRKVVNGKSVPKSRLVAANYRDFGAREIPTRSPTVTKAAQRVVLSLAASLDGKVYVRDISQAYTQSRSALERDVYLVPPPEMDIDDGMLLKCLKPLYGVPEAGLHWFLTYVGHHKTELGMTQTKGDKCLLYRRNTDGVGVSVTALQVDDNLGVGTNEFLDLEEIKSRNFRCKPRTIVENGDVVQFNGAEISRLDVNLFLMRQTSKLRSLKKANTQDELISVRAAMQYIATTSRPDLAASCQLLASRMGLHADSASYKQMNALVEIGIDSASEGLRFVPLDLESLRVVVFADASFANTSDYRSQIGFVICMVDGHETANIVHYGSTKCRRVTRSCMAAELHGLILGFDNAFLVGSMISEILNRSVAIDAYIDSKSVFDTITKLSLTTEKRLQIDAAALQESHLTGELRSLYWIPSNDNCADALTKEPYQKNSALLQLMRSNKINVSPTGWVHRTDKHECAVLSDAPSRKEEGPSVE
jgi:hypothetical protein